jgi:FkbM family methyltransferase
MTDSKRDFGDVLVFLRKAREVPPYPWEVFTHKGRAAHHRRVLQRRAGKVRARAAELGLVFPETWCEKEVAETYGVMCYSAFDVPGFAPAGQVVDAGAGFGDYAVVTSRRPEVKEVYSFEPDSLAAQRAREFIAANHSRARLVEGALGSGRGKLTLGDTGFDQLSILSQTGLKEVNLYAVDDLPFEPIDYIKINVEGAELEVLKGAKRTLVSSHPRLAVQCHTHQLAADVDRFLQGFGYRLAYVEGGARSGYPMDWVQNRYYLPPEAPTGPAPIPT